VSEERLARQCAKCGVTDTHAHHIQYASLNHPITGEPLDISISQHIQCCSDTGCEVCSTDVEFAPIKEIGHDFTAYMQAKTDEHHQALTDRHGVLTPLSAVPRAEEILEGR
jgi:hypothetical protein